MSLIKKYNELNENNDLETFLRGLSEEERMEIYTNALEGKNLDQDNPIIEEVKTDIDTFIQAALGTDAFRRTHQQFGINTIQKSSLVVAVYLNNQNFQKE